MSGLHRLEDLGLPVPPGELTSAAFIARVCRDHATREALVTEHERVTYAQLGARIRDAARALIGAGVGKGTRVGLLLGNRVELVVLLFAVRHVGGVVVPLSTYALPPERDHVLRHSDATVLVTQAELAGHRYVDELLARHPRLAHGRTGALVDPALPALRRVVCVGSGPPPSEAVETWDALVDAERPVGDDIVDALASETYPTDDAMLLYTSGTTALPKAVLHLQRAPIVQSWRWAEQLRISPGDRIWTTYPFFWTAGLAVALGGTLAGGATLVFQQRFEADSALELVEREGVTTIHAPLDVHAALADAAGRRPTDLSALRRVRRGSPLGEIAGIEVADWDAGGGYGSTETFTIATHVPADAPAPLRWTTHGLPLPGMRVRIVDPATGDELPTGAVGEIAVQGVTLMRGYYKEPPESCFDRDGWFHAADAGYLDHDGYLHWEGRVSGMIRTKGANVAPVEVERALLDWGGLRVAKVIGVPHPTAGEAVVLCAVRGGSATTEHDVVEALRTRVAAYKVPRRVLFFDDDDLVRTATDKLRVDELRVQAVARLVEDDRDPAWGAHLRALTSGA